MSAAVQLPLDGLPLDPIEVSELLAHQRAELYRELGLDHFQIAAAEQAVRLLVAGRYRKVAG
ncbi:MAG: hypothetical protein AABM42_02350 [Actinomycetota bacterium]